MTISPNIILIRSNLSSVMPAKAGIQRAQHKQSIYLSTSSNSVVLSGEDSPHWIPAFAGMTNVGVMHS